MNCGECITCGVCRCGKNLIMLAHLEHAIKNMTPRSRLFKIIKTELKSRGHWKDKPRGFYVAGKKNPSNFKNY